jgi:hypothetical protein
MIKFVYSELTTMSAFTIFIIAAHALIAWILIEIFVNLAHGLSRLQYIFWHYLVLILAFSGMFWLYFEIFAVGTSVFLVTLVGLACILLFELVVFRYLYSGERWFLNWTDWLFPIFIAISTMYLMGTIIGA